MPSKSGFGARPGSTPSRAAAAPGIATSAAAWEQRSTPLQRWRPISCPIAALGSASTTKALERNPNTKVKITFELEAETPSGFSEADIGVVRDNARQLKFK